MNKDFKKIFFRWWGLIFFVLIVVLIIIIESYNNSEVGVIGSEIGSLIKIFFWGFILYHFIKWIKSNISKSKETS